MIFFEICLTEKLKNFLFNKVEIESIHGPGVTKRMYAELYYDTEMDDMYIEKKYCLLKKVQMKEGENDAEKVPYTLIDLDVGLVITDEGVIREKLGNNFEVKFSLRDILPIIEYQLNENTFVKQYLFDLNNTENRLETYAWTPENDSNKKNLYYFSAERGVGSCLESPLPEDVSFFVNVQIENVPCSSEDQK